MNLGNKIKVLIGRKVLESRLKGIIRKPVVCNISDVRNIGIIYNATEYESFDIIKNLVKDLSRDAVKVTVLGYVHSKELIDNYLYRKGFEFFSKNELNWYYKPITPVVEEFIKEPFDILLNLSLEDHYPIRYITALSIASFKAGKFDANDKYLDLMIDIEKEKQMMRSLHYEILKEADQQFEDSDIEANLEKRTETELQLSFLINQLLHYLSILKK